MWGRACEGRVPDCVWMCTCTMWPVRINSRFPTRSESRFLSRPPGVTTRPPVTTEHRVNSESYPLLAAKLLLCFVTVIDGVCVTLIELCKTVRPDLADIGNMIPCIVLWQVLYDKAGFCPLLTCCWVLNTADSVKQTLLYNTDWLSVCIINTTS